MEILDRVEEELGKAEITQSREALQTLRELLMKAEPRLQGAKWRTKELLDHNVNDCEGRALEDHRKQMEFDKGRIKLMTLIVLAEDDAPAEEAVPFEGLLWITRRDDPKRTLPGTQLLLTRR